MTLEDAYERLKWLSDQLKCSPMKEAINTVLSSKNTENKTGLDENLLEKGIDHPENQQILSYKKDRLYTAEDMKAFAEWSYKQSYRKMWNEGKYIGYSGMLELWEKGGRNERFC
jgi:hypothetical protein